MLNAEIYCTAKCHQHLLIIKTIICILCLIIIVFYVLFDIITRFCAIVWGCLKLDSYWNIRCIVILEAYFSYLLFNKTKMNQTNIIYCSVEWIIMGKKISFQEFIPYPLYNVHVHVKKSSAIKQIINSTLQKKKA